MIAEIAQDITSLKSMIHSPDLVGRLKIADRLSVNCWFLAEMVADAYEQSTTNEFLYKSALSGAVADATGGVAKSEAKAKSDYKSLHEEWVKADQLYKRYNLLLQAAYTIIEQYRSSNSYLKMEYGNSRSQV